MKNGWIPAIRICHNCGEKITGYRNKDGILKVQCPKCRACMICKSMSRTHERVDVYAPPGEIIDN